MENSKLPLWQPSGLCYHWTCKTGLKIKLNVWHQLLKIKPLSGGVDKCHHNICELFEVCQFSGAHVRISTEKLCHDCFRTNYRNYCRAFPSSSVFFGGGGSGTNIAAVLFWFCESQLILVQRR
jgi:hypothetical protein